MRPVDLGPALSRGKVLTGAGKQWHTLEADRSARGRPAMEGGGVTLKLGTESGRLESVWFFVQHSSQFVANANGIRRLFSFASLTGGGVANATLPTGPGGGPVRQTWRRSIRTI